MEIRPGHFVAIIGGATSGSEAASQLSDRGIYTVVFEQNPRPYGKIEDGLPKWHVKLQAQEEKKIDEKLSKPNVFFVPNTKLGRDIDFQDIVHNWGFSAVLLASGAWKDRPLPIENVNSYIGKGLVYQNPLVCWFNHYHERDYQGELFKIPDNAIVIGGGLASLDVVKILMLETVLPALRERGIRIDILTLEHKSISTVLQENHLTLSDLGLNGCTLYYRRRIMDMPLVRMPVDATPERQQKVYQGRERIFNNFRSQFLFNFRECSFPTGMIVENDRLVGLKFVRTEIIDGKPVLREGTDYEVRSPLIVSSIGSIPEPITGIKMDGELFSDIDRETGQLKQFNRVFALGNVVTGQGNIKASLTHGRQVSEYVMDYFLAWRAEDYQKLLDRGTKDVRLKLDRITQSLADEPILRIDKIRSLIERIKDYQSKVAYDGDYHAWIEAHALEKIDETVANEP